MRLNFHHLRYFWAVAKEGHLTRAAERLHVSQSALSAQVRQLEDQLGHALFERDGRSLKLTESGHVVLGYAESIFGLGAELLELMKGGQGPLKQRLRVGSVATLSRNFQDNFLRPALGAPDVQLTLESGNLDELLARLGVHQLDLVLSNHPVGSGSGQPWRCQRIARQPVCLVGKPRAARKRFRFPQDLNGQGMLLPSRKSEIRSSFDLLCEELNIAVTVLAEVDDMAMLRLLTRDAPGIALLPEVVVQDELRSGELQRYSIVPQVYENFYGITAHRRFQPAVLQQLLALARRETPAVPRS